MLRGLSALETEHEHVVRSAREDFAYVRDAVAREPSRGERAVEIQIAAIVGGRVDVGKGEPQIADALIRHLTPGRRHHLGIHQLGRFLIFTGEDELANFGQCFARSGFAGS